jgi:uncharacterized protein YgiM (DUF1202 family)
MKKFIITVAVIAATALPAMASAFWGGEVVGVANWDVLNVRKWPSAQSQVVGSYDNGDPVSLTGRCKNISSNASFFIDNGNQSPAKKFAKMSKPNVWCQVMTDDAKLGWVRGSFVWPD